MSSTACLTQSGCLPHFTPKGCNGGFFFVFFFFLFLNTGHGNWELADIDMEIAYAHALIAGLATVTEGVAWTLTSLKLFKDANVCICWTTSTEFPCQPVHAQVTAGNECNILTDGDI